MVTNFYRLLSVGILVMLLGTNDQSLTAHEKKVEKKLTELPQPISESAATTIFTFFKDSYAPNSGHYQYPETSKLTLSQQNGKSGAKTVLEINLDPKDYSGCGLELYETPLNLKPYLHNGFIQFWVKGKNGGERAFIGFADDQSSDGKKTEIQVNLSSYGPITRNWTLIKIPLTDFGLDGAYYDPASSSMVPSAIQWDKITDVIITSQKGENKRFLVYLDDIRIVTENVSQKPVASVDRTEVKKGEKTIPQPAAVKTPSPEKKPKAVQIPGSRLYTDSVADIPIARMPIVSVIDSFLVNGSAVHGTLTTFGQKASWRRAALVGRHGQRFALMVKLENGVTSGIRIPVSRSVQWQTLRTGTAGIAFWLRCGRNVSAVNVGVVATRNGQKVYTYLPINDYAGLDTIWHYYMIPLKEFGDDAAVLPVGGATTTNDESQSNSALVFAWERIDEIIFSIEKAANRLLENESVSVYLDQCAVIASIVNYRDPDRYWKNFNSKEPDMTLFDFLDSRDQKWENCAPLESEALLSYTDTDASAAESTASLVYSYVGRNRGYVLYNFFKNSVSNQKRNWNRYCNLRMRLFTQRDRDTLRIQLFDSGNEAFKQTVIISRGWQEVVLPLAHFKKDAGEQSSDATINGWLDLTSVMGLGLKVVSASEVGQLRVGPIALTNQPPPHQ
ncbi:MAG: hypothetical protein JW795_19610 [Chitinivibrionales bacterium]|nr:hypothetical protein [Chitinivibrionales bacterium]